MIRSALSRLCIQCTTAFQLRYYSGHVKSFNGKKGFGFIHPEFQLQNEIIKRYGSWKDVFIHYTDIEDEIKLIKASDKVNFDCVFDTNGPVAINVTKVVSPKAQFVSEKWIEVPPQMDELVQKKKNMTDEQWATCVKSYYRKLFSKSTKDNPSYKKLQLKQSDIQNDIIDYINMANDVLSDMYHLQNKKQEKEKEKEN